MIFFWGCSPKSFVDTKSVLVLLKTKELKYYDAGFLKSGDGFLHLELFNASTPVLKIDIDKEHICFDSRCLEKSEFCREYLSGNYEKETLYNIFIAKPIFHSQNLVSNLNGFSQQIFKENSYDITYQVSKDEINFFDKINNIKIKVKYLK